MLLISLWKTMNCALYLRQYSNSQDGEHDFPNKHWTQYEAGFGDARGSYLLGLTHMHQLTYGGRQYRLRVNLMNFKDELR